MTGELAAVLWAIGMVESTWRMDLPMGPAGELGPLQITPTVIAELDRRGISDRGRAWSHDRCRELGYSLLVAETYLAAVAPGADAEGLARAWHRTGDRSGNKADAYWARVQPYLHGGESLVCGAWNAGQGTKGPRDHGTTGPRDHGSRGGEMDADLVAMGGGGAGSLALADAGGIGF